MRTIARPAVLAFAVVCAFAAHAHAQSPSTAQRHVLTAPAQVVLRAGDAVRVEISDDTTLAGEFVIGSDGAILLPIIGLVSVANRNFDEVRAELRTRYSKEFTNLVARFTPMLRIAVLGEVRTPGLYLVDQTYTVLDLIAQAGGLTPAANADRIMITRPNGEVTARIRSGASLGIALTSGDQVRVERRSWFRENLGIFVGAAGSLAVALVTGVLLR